MSSIINRQGDIGQLTGESVVNLSRIDPQTSVTSISNAKDEMDLNLPHVTRSPKHQELHDAVQSDLMNIMVVN